MDRLDKLILNTEELINYAQNSIEDPQSEWESQSSIIAMHGEWIIR